MFNHSAFTAEQNRIYNLIRGKQDSLCISGLQLDLPWERRRGTISLTLIHSACTTKLASEMSARLTRITSSILYGPEDIHTTLCADPFAEPFIVENRHRILLESLSGVAQKVARKPWHPKIIYPEWLLTESSVIAPGIGDNETLSLLEAVADACETQRVPVRIAWGMAITCGRFYQHSEGEHASGLLYWLRHEPPIGEVFPSASQSGTLTGVIRSRNGHFKVYRQFNWA